MVIQVRGENSKGVSKFLPVFTFRHNFKQDNNQINIYISVFHINKLTFFIIILKIGAYHKYVLFVSFRFLPLIKEKLKRFFKLMYWKIYALISEQQL